MKAPTIAITHEREHPDRCYIYACTGSVTLDGLALLLGGGRTECGVCWNRIDPADWTEDDDNLHLVRPLRVKAIPPEDGF